MNHRQATDADLQTIKELLDIGKLPLDDCAEHIEDFIVIEEKGKIIGMGGLEICGAVGLVRSIVVDPAYRGSGIAKNIFRLIEVRAIALGINRLYLLTESATEYFARLGFSIQERSEVPASVMATRQLKELCPSSARVMFREVSDGNRD
ncbi:MAG: GNAT family N-acetyltransferase [Candidatus Thiodiazotropha sp. (ex Epidulcina cf. delphinae)]|nr:GNAT family N-acetyltransferase [Candidatus Thiodiazotropha sp. (ex Epidulcina cf. delphinae)]